MRRTIFSFLTALSVLLIPDILDAQENVVEKINRYGTFDNWNVREIKESGAIGGKVKELYEFYGNQEVVRTKEPFVSPEDYLWRTNNVLAVVAGVRKTSVTVFPEKRDSGYCARIETHIEKVKVLGIVNMEVTCQGALIVGNLPEPIRDTKDPMAKVDYGIPFQGRPKSVVYDFKADVGHETIRGTGFSALKNLGYPDYPQATVILQKRWEDEDGQVHALRVGTAMKRFKVNSPNWINGYEMDIHYGDIRGEWFYEDYMGLIDDPEIAFHTINSKGENVMVKEEGWASADEQPNWIVINFLASSELAFHGGVGNTLWVDNVKVVMP